MPKTRQDIDREAKVEEILEAAERRLREGGYEGLSVAAIARELGLAQNAIYWYFPSKDHLFVRALERMLRTIVARKPKHDVGTVELVLWFTDQFAAVFDLQGAMNEQARRSQVVAEFVRELDSVLDHMLSNVFRPYVSEEELPSAVGAFRATVQGAYLQGLDRKDRRRLLAYTLDRLTGGISAGPSAS
jgi:AcrR family transcriptional regulator